MALFQPSYFFVDREQIQKQSNPYYQGYYHHGNIGIHNLGSIIFV